MDFWSSMTAMTREVEAHGKTWILIDQVQQSADKTGWYWLAVEKGASLPALVQMVLIPNPTNSNDEQPTQEKI